MQVSLNWLNEFVDLSDIEVEQIAHELTMSGLEVEAVEELKPQFTNIKTVKIEKIDNFDNNYVERELAKNFANVIRWAIVEVSEKDLTVSISYEM